MLNKARIAVLVSGGGTNLEALLNAQETGALPHGEIVLVLSSNPEAYALERAKRRGVPAIPLSRKQLGQEPFEAALMEALTQYRVDLVVLAGVPVHPVRGLRPSLAGPDRQRPSLPDPRLLWEGVLRAEGP